MRNPVTDPATRSPAGPPRRTHRSRPRGTVRALPLLLPLVLLAPAPGSAADLHALAGGGDAGALAT